MLLRMQSYHTGVIDRPPAASSGHAPARHRCQKRVARVAQEDRQQLMRTSAPQRAPTPHRGNDAAPAQPSPHHQQPQHHAPASSWLASTGSLSSAEALGDDEPAPASSGSGVDPSTMFDTSHIAALTPQMALYFPFGAALAVLRTSLWILGIAVDAPWFASPAVVAAYLSLLGFSARVRGAHHLPQGRHVLASNHVSVGDLMMLFQLPQRYVHLVTSALPAATTRARNLPARLVPASSQAIEQLAQWPEGSLPVHIFPEGGMTNGSAMLQFSRGFTKLLAPGVPVVPLAIKVGPPSGAARARRSSARGRAPASSTCLCRLTAAPRAPRPCTGPASSPAARCPFPPQVTNTFGIRTHTLHSSFLGNLFWYSFSPATLMELVVLPPVEPAEGEGRGAFAQRVQGLIAAELGVPVSGMTIRQKKKLAQQKALRR
jgi:hypothetical protein